MASTASIRLTLLAGVASLRVASAIRDGLDVFRPRGGRGGLLISPHQGAPSKRGRGRGSESEAGQGFESEAGHSPEHAVETQERGLGEMQEPRAVVAEGRWREEDEEEADIPDVPAYALLNQASCEPSAYYMGLTFKACKKTTKDIGCRYFAYSAERCQCCYHGSTTNIDPAVNVYAFLQEAWETPGSFEISVQKLPNSELGMDVVQCENGTALKVLHVEIGSIVDDYNNDKAIDSQEMVKAGDIITAVNTDSVGDANGMQAEMIAMPAFGCEQLTLLFRRTVAEEPSEFTIEFEGKIATGISTESSPDGTKLVVAAMTRAVLQYNRRSPVKVFIGDLITAVKAYVGRKSTEKTDVKEMLQELQTRAGRVFVRVRRVAAQDWSPSRPEGRKDRRPSQENPSEVTQAVEWNPRNHVVFRKVDGGLGEYTLAVTKPANGPSSLGIVVVSSSSPDGKFGVLEIKTIKDNGIIADYNRVAREKEKVKVGDRINAVCSVWNDELMMMELSKVRDRWDINLQRLPTLGQAREALRRALQFQDQEELEQVVTLGKRLHMRREELFQALQLLGRDVQVLPSKGHRWEPPGEFVLAFRKMPGTEGGSSQIDRSLGIRILPLSRLNALMIVEIMASGPIPEHNRKWPMKVRKGDLILAVNDVRAEDAGVAAMAKELNDSARVSMALLHHRATLSEDPIAAMVSW